MSIPTEAERRAKYNADMAATVAACGSTNRDPGPLIPGQGCLQTSDTARHVHQMAERRAAQIADKLTPAEIIQADSAGRQAARQHAKLAGINLSDYDLQAAGRKMVQSKADAK